ncbi:MAG: class I SAM-dependent methyltransferase [Verrucomicrobia bacterium]|nr:class I SAM-dependent methyltransferase [Verrucomicrobiota bacterium]
MSHMQPPSILPTIAAAPAAAAARLPDDMASGAEAGGGTQDAQGAPTWTEAVARRLVGALFEPMTRGCLRWRCPDGSTRVFGTEGASPSAEIHIRRWRFFTRCAKGGDIGFGEAYQNGDWETPDLAAVIAWFCANVDRAPSMSGSALKRTRFTLLNAANRLRHFLNRNSLTGSRANIAAHYDLGNGFYSQWLDATMTYSAALFESPDQSLEAAQSAKYERLCRELRLKAGEHLLEIGSGWGGMASHAARRHGVRVTTITLSEAQAAYCRERFRREGIDDRAEVRVVDYRNLSGSFDKVVSIEMMEAIGDRYLEAFCRTVQRLLKPDGLFAAQFITYPDSRHAELRRSVDWIQKHIFPGSLLLSLNRVNECLQRTGRLHLHTLHDMGLDYGRTLREWRARFNGGLGEVRRQGFDEHFIRTWNYYLAYCESAFLWRNISVVQATWTAPNNRSLMAAD